MKQDIFLREAEASDTATLDIVRRQAIEIGLTDEYERDQFADLVAQPDPDLQNWIESDSFSVSVIGSDLTPFSYGILDLNTGEIKGLYTAENYRKEGYGSRLIDYFVSEARENDLTKLDVKSPKNTVKFFLKNNFNRLDQTHQHSETGIKLVEMEKNLPE